MKQIDDALAAFFGSYDNPLRMGMNVVAWIALVYSLVSIGQAYQQGAENCVKFGPLVEQAQSCLATNNASVARPDFVFVPQLDCRRVPQSVAALTQGYNYTGKYVPLAPVDAEYRGGGE